MDLVAHGIDTDAVLRLDGVEFARTCNQHRGYRFDLRSHAGPGRHTLSIDLLSPRKAAYDFTEQVESVPVVGDNPPWNAIRKMACSFSSDWGPALPAAALWKPVELETWDDARLDEVRCRARVADDGTGRIEVTARLERTTEAMSTVKARVEHPDGSVTTEEAHSDGGEIAAFNRSSQRLLVGLIVVAR